MTHTYNTEILSLSSSNSFNILSDSNPDIKNTVVCSICLNSKIIEPIVMLECHHLFHQPCIQEWIHRSPSDIYTCPLCRSVNKKEKCERCKQYLYITYKPYDCCHTYHYECGDYSKKCIKCVAIDKEIADREKLKKYIDDTNKCSIVDQQSVILVEQSINDNRQSITQQSIDIQPQRKCFGDFDYERIFTCLCFPLVICYVSYCEDRCRDLD